MNFQENDLTRIVGLLLEDLKMIAFNQILGYLRSLHLLDKL